ncbi:MAG: glycine--tRNA ligase subunit beta [Nitrospiraceae bacterium]|uniref:glycine--tRNA ligase subunit beta n=1 Tax=Nitrospira cf. moscoviensis SBR1015 TaxID=96242 RepID=UPI000B3BCB7C|nr:glycine--tRNA ligase subunit beta [Nitrospira cf. moscoviensis SBR1015]MBY0246832.1 glycine--tRNA ligase subunit beta [Nitrospiraceae bacterium]
MAMRKQAGRPGIKLKKTVRASAPAVAELLLEIGVEELPYHFIVPALASLKESAERLFRDQRLAFQSIRTLGTPRRLTVVVEGLATGQTSIVKEAMGPSKTVAFDQAGQPTRAAMGFAAGQGVAVQDLQVRQTPKGEYLFAVKHEKGQSATSVLADVLPRLVSALTFPKAMKWNETGVRFARPVRWVLALYGGVVLPIEAAGIKASDRTRGHRVVGGGKWLSVRDAASYVKILERQGVIVDPQRRRQLIQEQIATVCSKTGFRLNEDEALLDQAVYTTELPSSIIGSFKEAYLDVPEEILITSMKEHQGFFSLRHKQTGKLVAHFIAVANNRVKDMSLIREGNERVLAARLADAKFFFDEDRKVKLADRGKKLAGVTFHQKLGTMEQKQERVRKLAGFIAAHLYPGQDELRQACDRAASLSKADLLSGIVGEFPELQGIMGGEYALHDGESAAVAQAIREQYLPKAIEGELPKTIEGQILSLADRLDSIAAFFHVGIVPTGSEDPFALRRHATAIVRIMLECNLRTDVGPWIEHARTLVSDHGFKGTPDTGDQGRRRIVEFLFERVRHYGRVVHLLRDDVIEAVLKPAYDKPLDLVDLGQKMKALEAVTRKPEFDPLIVGFKRAHRLVEKEQWTRDPVDPAKFQHAVESVLQQVVTDERGRMAAAMSAGDYHQALEALVRLKPAIDAFFTAVMVNADDKVVRNNRLSLLKEVDDLFMAFADFSQIVVQGS